MRHQDDSLRDMLHTIRNINEDYDSIFDDENEENTSTEDNSDMMNGVDASDNIEGNSYMSLKSKKCFPITNDIKYGQNTLDKVKDDISAGMGTNVEYGQHPLLCYPDEKIIQFIGTVPDLNNLKFEYRFNDRSGNGCYIWANTLPLNDNSSKLIAKIYSLFENWKDFWVQNSAIVF